MQLRVGCVTWRIILEMSLTKHNSYYAVYSVWCGREDGPHQLVEESNTLDGVYSCVHGYTSPNNVILIVDMNGVIIKRYEPTTKNK